jgi:hypothetical protein
MRGSSLLKHSLTIIAASAITFAMTVNTATAEPRSGGNSGLRGAANYGGFGSAPSALWADTEVAPATPKNGLCTGTFTNVVSNVIFQRSKNGSLTWGFKLTKRAIAELGAIVTVSMPTATVNGHAINPPYEPHTEVSTYNFHGSLYRYNRFGKHVYTLATGNKIFFYWVIEGETGTDAYRYIRCTVPRPGSA